MRWVWTGCIIPIVLYGCHLWAFNATKTQKKLLDKISYMALTNIAHCHKGTPLAGLQTILNAPPLDILAKEYALAAMDRLQLHQDLISTNEDLPKKGHIKLALDTRNHIVGNKAPDYDVQINRRGKYQIYTRQANEDESADIDVYTDGSKMDTGTGCAYTIVQNNNELTYGQFKLNQDATVYQAELIAIEMAALRLQEMNIGGRIHFHTDSLSSLQTLKMDTLTSIQAIRTAKALRETSRPRRVKLKLYWVKAHVGIRFNERADALAKDAIGAGIPHQVETSRKTLKMAYRQYTHEAWGQRWASKPNDYKRTRVWFPKIDPKTSQTLMTRNRSLLSKCIQWITGFCNLMRHRHKKNMVISDLCRLCGEDMETPEHLSFHCPRLVQARTDCFLTHEGQTDWNIYKLEKFLKQDIITDLLTDQTNYRM
jgi:ribonuclease HI